MIEVIVVLIVVGVCLYLVNAYVPMAPPIKTVLMVIVVLCLCIWLLNVFGITNFHPAISR
jgi:hypothetical protein